MIQLVSPKFRSTGDLASILSEREKKNILNPTDKELGSAKCLSVSKYIFVWYNFFGEDLFAGNRLRNLLSSCVLNRHGDRLTSFQVKRILDIIEDLRTPAIFTPFRFRDNMLSGAFQKGVQDTVRKIKEDASFPENHNLILSYASKKEYARRT